MTSQNKQTLFWTLAPMGVGMIVPSAIIFLLAVAVAHTGPLDAMADIVRKQFAPGENLFFLSLLGLIPFAALSLACFFASRHLPPMRLACVAVGGLVGILVLMVPGHVSVWYPLYGGGHQSSTAVIAFVFIPFFCMPPLGIGLLVGWAVSLLPFARKSSASTK